ncbi:hypothetical protein [Lactobacillus corticis]|uniref:Uncharacterized protein n=1 Tax=Lactobacillus corticis TaxID=2201249 RepID=A0A916QJP5_9LACO|nr:hypothetical protein [Lactobacillus corticis]GFZ27592.1 hypothetical protein LCB40_14720 [Lactobacillus corticis]
MEKEIYSFEHRTDQLLSRVEIDLVSRPEGKVWAVGAVMVNPSADQTAEYANLYGQIAKFNQKYNFPLWLLDPSFKSYIVEHAPANEVLYRN